MKRMLIIAVAAIVTALGAHAQRPAALSKGADVPLEMTVYQADLVVQGRLIRAEAPKNRRMQVPGDLTLSTADFQKFALEVQDVIKESPSPNSPKPRNPATSQPASARGTHATTQPRRLIEFYSRWLPNDGADAPGLVKLEVGTEVIVVLYRVPMQSELYLPANDMHRFRATKENLTRMQQATVDHWSWGEESSGLKLALLAEPKVPVANTGPSMLQAVLAVRNVSKEPIHLNINPEDKPFGMSAGVVGKPATASDLYASVHKLKPGVSAVQTVRPGRVVFLATSGPVYAYAPMGVQIDVGSPDQKWQATAQYTNKADKTAEGKPLWTGTINSKPVSIEPWEPHSRDAHPTTAPANRQSD